MNPLEVFKKEADSVLNSVRRLYAYAIQQNLINTLDFINWQDTLNVYSLLPSEDAKIIND